MTWTKIAAAVLGAVLIGLVLVAVFGIPAGALIDSLARDAAAKRDLQVTIAGPARLTLWPVGLTAEKVDVRDAKSGEQLVTVAHAQVGVALGDLIRGRIRLTEVALTRPVVRFDAMSNRAERNAGSRTPGKGVPLAMPPVDGLLAVDAITAEDATFILRDRRRTVDIHAESLRLVPTLANDRLNVKLDARIGGRAMRLVADTDAPSRWTPGKPVAVEAKIEAEGIFRTPATVTANIQTSGPVLRIESLKGTADQVRLGGTVSVSFAGAKPFIDADLEADRLDLTGFFDTPAPASGPRAHPLDRAPAAGGNPGAPRPWSDQPIDLFGLHMVEANVKVAAREVLLRKVRMAPVELETTLLQDVLTLKLARASLYGGQADGELTVDATPEVPNLALRMNFSGLSALPFLTDAVDFQHLEGRARGKLDLKAAGASPRRVMASTQGNAELVFEDGAVRGIDVVKMVRSLADAILSGWQENASEQTRFSSFSATFRAENGLARTDDLRFVGPFVGMSGTGTVDLPNQTLNFRMDPRVVLSAEGQGRRSEPWGIGVPVLIQGPWSQPRIHADLPGILSNPEGALQALRNSLGGMGGTGQPGAQPGAPAGKFMEGLTQGMDPAKRDQLRNGAAIADDILRALSGDAAKDPAPPRDGTAPPPADKPAAGRDWLKDLFGR